MLNTRLQKLITNHENKIHGEIGLLIKNSTDESEIFSYKKSSVTETSSTIKIAIILLTFELIACGQISLNTVLKIDPLDRHYGSGVVYWTDWAALTLEQHLGLMAKFSDCVCTNTLIRRLGGIHQINKRLNNLGFKKTKLIMPVLKFDKDNTGTTYHVGQSTAYEMVEIFDACLNYNEPLGDFYRKITSDVSTSWFGDSNKILGKQTINLMHKTGSMVNIYPGKPSSLSVVGCANNQAGQPILFAMLTSGEINNLPEIDYKIQLVDLFWELFNSYGNKINMQA